MQLPAFIQKFIRYRSYKKAVKQADHLRSMYHKKYLVLLWKNEFKAISKQTLRNMHKAGVFKKSGKKLRQVESLAVYTTN